MVCERCGTVFCWDDADSTALGQGRKRFCSKVCKKRFSMQQSGAKARQNRNHALRERAREKREHDLAVCQARGKRKYPDVVAAREDAGRIMQRKGWVLYPYLCVCGAWHLTSTAPDTTKDDWFYGDLADEIFIAKGLSERLT